MPSRKPKLTFLRPLIEVFIIFIFLVTQVYLIGTKNVFFTRVWEYWQKNNPTVSGYLSYIGFGARLAYSEAAFNTYEEYPFLGVGLGNFAYYFEEQLPYRPLADSPEILRLITPEEGRNRLITVKNFYLRLLAETGIVGTAAFMAFLIAVLGCGLFLLLSPNKEQVYWGIAGLCGLISFSISAFTFDSFVFPNMWLVFGITTAAAWIFKRSNNHVTNTNTNLDSP
jgi:O-antigen ligase